MRGLQLWTISPTPQTSASPTILHHHLAIWTKNLWSGMRSACVFLSALCHLTLQQQQNIHLTFFRNTIHPWGEPGHPGEPMSRVSIKQADIHLLKCSLLLVLAFKPTFIIWSNHLKEEVKVLRISVLLMHWFICCRNQWRRLRAGKGALLLHCTCLNAPNFAGEVGCLLPVMCSRSTEVVMMDGKHPLPSFPPLPKTRNHSTKKKTKRKKE